MQSNETGRKLRTVETAIQLLDVVREHGGLNTAEIASELGLAKSTVHGYLSTLETHNYVYKEGQTYRIGAEMLNVGSHVRHRHPHYRLATGMVDEISGETTERAQFIVEEYGKGVVIHTSTGSKGVQVDSRIGKRSYLHASSAGKAILAWSSRDLLDDVIDQVGLVALTDNTITDRGELVDELEAISERGYSYNREESIEGLHAVGVPLLHDGAVVGAISVSGPSHRLAGPEFETEIPNYLLGMANEFNLRVTHSNQDADGSASVESRW